MENIVLVLQRVIEEQLWTEVLESMDVREPL